MIKTISFPLVVTLAMPVLLAAVAGCSRPAMGSEAQTTVTADLTVGSLSITGAVITPKGGVVGAIVDLGGNGAGLKAITGTNGAYAFSNLSPGSYGVSVEPVSNCTFGGNIPLNNLTASATGINIVGSCTGTVPVIVGPQGPAGPAGATGATGATGAMGATGAPGAIGAPGATGAQGLPGLPGATGAQGPSGPQGTTGQQGPAGPQGATGPQGPVGPAGPAGGGNAGLEIYAATSTTVEIRGGEFYQAPSGLKVPAGTYLVQGGYSITPAGTGTYCDIAIFDSTSANGRQVVSPAALADIVTTTTTGDSPQDQVWFSAIVNVPTANTIQVMCTNPAVVSSVLELKTFTASVVGTLHQQ